MSYIWGLSRGQALIPHDPVQDKVGWENGLMHGWLITAAM